MLIPSILYGCEYPLEVRHGQDPLHRHEFCQLEVVLEGTCLALLEDTRQEVGAGTWLWVASGVKHAFPTTDRMRAVTFRFACPKALEKRLFPHVIQPPGENFWIEGLPGQILNAWQTKNEGLRNAANHLLAAAIEFALAAREHPQFKGLNSRWVSLLNAIRNAKASRLSLREMARRVNLSPSHFRRMFRQHMGMSPGDFQRQCQLEWARGALEYTSIPLKVIAGQTGYSDLSAFSKAFLRHFGKRPSVFRPD
ncbi:MAG: AraC family transcriptional regulator [Verrucomicrobiae bacterium]|nr:AraC family transcriptional regulator [Verrucomicrobiae bacterium]